MFASQFNSNSRAYSPKGFVYSSHTYQLLNNWQLAYGIDTVKQSITLPYFSPENVNIIVLETTFKTPDSLKNHNLRIHILGIEGLVRISLNDQILRTHINFPSSYSIDIPAYIWQKNHLNQLELIIKKPEDIREGIPCFVQIFRQKKYLAIPREISLEWIPPVYLSKFQYDFSMPQLKYSYNLTIQPTDTSTGLNKGKLRIIEEVFSPDGGRIYNRFEYLDNKNGEEIIKRQIQIPNALTWSPESPNLYKIKIEIHSSAGLLTTYQYPLGLREVEIRNKNFYLNNQPLSIHGITYRLNNSLFKHAGGYLEIINIIKQDLSKIKMLGFNAIRFPHYVPHPYVADLADSLGLLLFIENGIWRIPEEYFTQDKFLQYTKSIVTEIVSTFHLHPSLFAIGLGQEIDTQDNYVQKFILILNEYLQQNYKILTYISPLNMMSLHTEDLTDFYLIAKYEAAVLSYHTAFKKLKSEIQVPVVLANVGFAINPKKKSDSITEYYPYIKMNNFFKLYNYESIVCSFFIESYNDWEAAIPSRIIQDCKEDNTFFYPYGLLGYNGKPRYLFNKIPNLLAGNLSEITDVSEVINRTNVFSLTVFLSSVLFFLIYRQSFRLRESLKRSLGHPYGFFVDLRDRRIIPTFNSTLIGLYTLLLLTNLLAALIYYFHDGLLFEEYVSVILVPLGLKSLYLTLSQSPLLLVFFTWFIFTIMQILLILLVRIFSIFSKQKIRARQILAACNWAGSPFIFLLPVSLLSYQLLHYKTFQIIIIIIITLYFFWFNYRLGNGLRILFIASSYKVFLIMILTYSAVLSIFVAFFSSKYDMINYFQLLNQARNLF